MWDWIFSGVRPEVAEHWDYAMITLMVRFIGVFVVMAVMQVALQVSARVVRALERRQAAGNAPANPGPVPDVSAPSKVEPSASEAASGLLDEATVAAIGLALSLESRQPSPVSPSGGPSAWASASRMRRMPEPRRR